MSEWKEWAPEYTGQRPPDWDGGPVQVLHSWNNWGITFQSPPVWNAGFQYSYRAAQPNCPAPIEEATYEPDLLAMCRALPKDQQEALIAALQEPVMDWADDVADYCLGRGGYEGRAEIVAYIRSRCQPQMQHVAYYSHGEFNWTSGIAPRDCELYAVRKGASS